jgi:hypothetical protein
MIFKGQDLKVEIDTGIDLTGGTAVIRYRKPNGTKGEWSAQIDDTIVYYNATPEDLDDVGLWKLQAIVDVSDKVYKSKIVYQRVNRPLVAPPES